MSAASPHVSAPTQEDAIRKALTAGAPPSRGRQAIGGGHLRLARGC